MGLLHATGQFLQQHRKFRPAARIRWEPAALYVCEVNGSEGKLPYRQQLTAAIADALDTPFIRRVVVRDDWGGAPASPARSFLRVTHVGLQLGDLDWTGPHPQFVPIHRETWTIAVESAERSPEWPSSNEVIGPLAKKLDGRADQLDAQRWEKEPPLTS